MQTQTIETESIGVEVFFSTPEQQAPGTVLWNEWEGAPYGEGWFFWLRPRAETLPMTPAYGPYPDEQRAKEIALEMFGDEMD